MKLILLILSVCFIGCVARAQNIVQASFQKDGRLWVSYDNVNARTRVFTPADVLYECTGDTYKFITNYTRSNNLFKIEFGKEWVEVSKEVDGHLMFSLMMACIDKEYIHCPCSAKFKILKQSK